MCVKNTVIVVILLCWSDNNNDVNIRFFPHITKTEKNKKMNGVPGTGKNYRSSLEINDKPLVA